MPSPSTRVRVLAGLLGVTVIGGGIVYWVNIDEIRLNNEIGRRFDCPEDLVPPLPSAATVEPMVTDLELTPFADAAAVTAIAVDPVTGDVFIGEKRGRVLRAPAGGGAATVALDLTDRILATGNEQGLLGLAFEPDGGHLYISSIDPKGDSRLDSFAVDGARISPDGDLAYRADQPHEWHNGGGVATDSSGSVWFSLGDGGRKVDQDDNGQDRSEVLGSLLRFDVAEDGEPLVPAAGNPFIDDPDGADEIWAYGLRNPWRFWIDEAADRVVVADVGDNCFEEVDVIPLDDPGANLGWRRVEGPHVFDEPGPEDALGPRFAYPRGEGACAVIGGVGTDENVYPTLAGRYLFSDLCASQLLLLDLDDDGPPVPTDLGVSTPTTFAVGPDGTVYVGSLSDGVVRLGPKLR